MWLWKLLNSYTSKTAFFPQAFVMHSFWGKVKGTHSHTCFDKTDRMPNLNWDKMDAACFIVSILVRMPPLHVDVDANECLGACVCFHQTAHFKCR